jgi:hypothetical protein
MTLTLELPSDLESRVNSEAARRGLSPADCVLEVLDAAMPDTPLPTTPAELVDYWEREGVLGIWADRTDIPDSPEYARQLRHQAEQHAESQENKEKYR